MGQQGVPATISELNTKAYVHIEDWRNRPLQGRRYPYVYVDGLYLRRNWGGEFENVAILVAIAVNEDGYREVLGAAEGMKEDKASWVSFFQWLRGRGLDGVKLFLQESFKLYFIPHPCLLYRRYIAAHQYESQKIRKILSNWVNIVRRSVHRTDHKNHIAKSS